MTHARAKLHELAGLRRSVGGRVLVYRPNADGERRKPFAAHPAAAASSTPASSDLRPFAPPVLDQGPTGSCTGHGTATGLVVAFAAAGKPLPWLPSPAEIYRNGRALERVARASGGFDPLSDDGARPSIVIHAVNAYGVEATKDPAGGSDADPATINDEPGLADVETERLRRPVEELAIEDCSNGRPLAAVVEDIRKALTASPPMPVCFGAFVDTAFQEWAPSSPPAGAPDTNDPNGGGHWVCIIGHRTEADGSTSFRVRNSWSAQWGDEGDIWVGPAFVEQITDITPIAAKEQ